MNGAAECCRWRQKHPQAGNLPVHARHAIDELDHHLSRLEQRAERLETCACRAGPLYSGVTPLTVGNGARWAKAELEEAQVEIRKMKHILEQMRSVDWSAEAHTQ